jgi:hypothetical protein
MPAYIIWTKMDKTFWAIFKNSSGHPGRAGAETCPDPNFYSNIAPDLISWVLRFSSIVERQNV